MLDRRSFLVWSAALVAGRTRAGPRRLVVTLQPLTPAPAAADVDFVARAVRAFFDVDVVVARPEPLPPSAWYPPRKRHRAEKILEVLEQRVARDKVIGLTSGDISTTKGNVLDWGILGLGDIGGGACVVSRHRARTRVQLGKVAVHELGHVFGSPHCPTPGCLMNDARGTLRTVDRERRFCEATRALFRERGAPLVDDPRAPW